MPPQDEKLLEEFTDKIIRQMAEERVIHSKKKNGGEKQEVKKPSVQQQLDMLVTHVEMVLDQCGMQMRYGRGSWHLYEDGYWRIATDEDKENLDRILSETCVGVGIVYAKNERTVWTHLRTSKSMMLPPEAVFDEQPWVAMKNGTLDVSNGSFSSFHAPDYYTTRYIDIDFDANATCPEWLAMLDSILEDKDREDKAAIKGLLQEWFGVALLGGSASRTPRALRKALFLYGPPRTGKTTILEVLRAMLGTNRVVATKVKDVSKDFALQGFLSAAAWLSEETDDTRGAPGSTFAGIDSARIKNLITGETMAVPRKYMTDATLRFAGPVAWAGNDKPAVTGTDNALYERILVISLDRTFTAMEAHQKFGEQQPVDWLVSKGELPGILMWAIQGYKRLLKRGRYEDVADLMDAGSAWRQENDPLFGFLSECCEYTPSIQNETATVAWAAQAYTKAIHGKFSKMPKIRSDIRKVVPEVYPAVKVDRQRLENGTRPYLYVGLKLNTRGIHYLEQAKRDSEIAARDATVVNQPVPEQP